MKVIELIRHYDRSKSIHAAIEPSLASKLVQLMDVFGQLDATTTTGADYATVCIQALPGAKPGTVLRVLAQLRAVLRAAARDGLLAAVPHIPMPAVYDQVDCPITPSEAKLLLAHLAWTAPRWHPLATALIYTGGRLNEILSSDPTSLGTDSFTIRKPAARRSKTVTRDIPIPRSEEHTSELQSQR